MDIRLSHQDPVDEFMENYNRLTPASATNTNSNSFLVEVNWSDKELERWLRQAAPGYQVDAGLWQYVCAPPGIPDSADILDRLTAEELRVHWNSAWKRFEEGKENLETVSYEIDRLLLDKKKFGEQCRNSQAYVDMLTEKMKIAWVRERTAENVDVHPNDIALSKTALPFVRVSRKHVSWGENTIREIENCLDAREFSTASIPVQVPIDQGTSKPQCMGRGRAFLRASTLCTFAPFRPPPGLSLPLVCQQSASFDRLLQAPNSFNTIRPPTPIRAVRPAELSNLTPPRTRDYDRRKPNHTSAQAGSNEKTFWISNHSTKPKNPTIMNGLNAYESRLGEIDPFQLMELFPRDMVVKMRLNKDQPQPSWVHISAKTNGNYVGPAIGQRMAPFVRQSGSFNRSVSRLEDSIDGNHVVFRDLKRFLVCDLHLVNEENNTTLTIEKQRFFVSNDFTNLFLAPMRIQLGADFVNKFVHKIASDGTGGEKVQFQNHEGRKISIDWEWKRTEGLPPVREKPNVNPIKALLDTDDISSL